MATTLDISINHREWKDNAGDVSVLSRKILKEVLDKAGLSEYAGRISISMLLTDDATLQDLNLRFRGKDKPTNVLSFPAIDVDGLSNMLGRSSTNNKNNPLFIGDLAFAFETIEREAKEQQKIFKNHFIHMLVHGILHLLGYDHEDKKSREKMERMEISILQKFGIGNPYEV